MDREEESVSSVYIYNGFGEVPEDVTHVRVHPSVAIIPREVFQHRYELEVVELPEGLITIEDKAFYCCRSLTRINFPSTLEDIGRGAFNGCEALDGVVLPVGLLTLEIAAFYSCSSLQRINIPSTVTSIGGRTFEYCGKLELAVLPEGLRRLGERAFYHCHSLKTINIPPYINTIEQETFLHCHRLTDVVFSECIKDIGKDAFSRCKSLVSVTLPSSLKVIGVEAFEGCPLLKKIHIPDTIESIETGAFKNCNFTNFRIPPSITGVNVNILTDNTCLVSLELPENVSRIKFGKETNSLRNITLPSQCQIDEDANTMWIHHIDLKVALFDTDDDNDKTISDALKQRFDDLPIHKICYYQSYSDNETTMQHLRREINPWTSNPPGQLNITGKQQDCLGMTPLHILACSTKQHVEMYQLLIDKYPETLIVKDKWGDIPLMYAFWCNAPTEIVDLLVESYKSLHPDYKFDWKGMLESLVKRDVPLANIQRLVNTHEKNFSDQCLDMQQVVAELATYDETQASLHLPFTSDKTFRYLLEVSVSKRLDTLDIAKWRIDLESMISTFPKKANCRDRYTRKVCNKLATYESIKEGTSVLELALWKAKIDEGRSKRARVDSEVGYKKQCRINCGAHIIIQNVLPYLVPELEYGSIL